jgi:hypothetical protein
MLGHGSIGQYALGQFSQNAAVAGQLLTVEAVLISGTASGGAAASDGSAPGDLVTLSCSIEGGEATAGSVSLGWFGPPRLWPSLAVHAEAPGAILGVTVSLVPGQVDGVFDVEGEDLVLGLVLDLAA